MSNVLSDPRHLRHQKEEAHRKRREKLIRKAYVEYLGTMPLGSLPVTLIFSQWLRTGDPFWRPPITQIDASSTVRAFLYRIDRAVFKNAARPGPDQKRLCRFFVFEWGHVVGLHCHGAIERPMSIDEADFSELLKSNWVRLENTVRLHAGSEASEKWNKYTLKAKRSGPLSDHIDAANLHLPTPNP